MVAMTTLVMILAALLSVAYFFEGSFILGAFWAVIAILWNSNRKSAIESEELEKRIEKLRKMNK